MGEGCDLLHLDGKAGMMTQSLMFGRPAWCGPSACMAHCQSRHS